MELVPFIVKNWILFAALLLIIAMIIANEFILMRAKAFMISVMETLKASNDDEAVLIDIRSANDFKKGHLPQAQNIPQAEVTQKLAHATQYAGKKVILYCATDVRSNQLCKKLKKMHSDIALYSMQGGISAWQQANLPISKSKK